MKRMRAFIIASCMLLFASLRAQSGPQKPASELALNHVVVAVNDLEKAAAQYRVLGFTLKPGRPHANGIRNWHVKFADGTEVELLTAPEARDDLTRKYRKLLAEGDGGAFLALFPGNFPTEGLQVPSYVFFGGLNHSPTDKPEHFIHENTVDSLVGVWVADPELGRALGREMKPGTTQQRADELAPLGVHATIVQLRGGEVLLLPESSQLINGRAVIGVVLRVKNLGGSKTAQYQECGCDLVEGCARAQPSHHSAGIRARHLD